MATTSPKHDIMDLFPATTPNYAVEMWLGALQFSLNDAPTVEAYRVDTGDKWKPSAVPIDQMIDEATDRKWHFVKQFTLWFNTNVWGDCEDGDDESPD